MIKAEYIDSMGDDLRVVNAARVSFDKEGFWALECDCPSCLEANDGKPEKVLSKQDAKLIGYLARGMSEKERNAILEEAANSDDIEIIQDCFSRMNANSHWTPFSHCFITMRETVPIFVARQRFKHMVGFTYNEVSRRYVDDKPEFYVPDVWRKRPEGGIKQGSSDEIVTHLNFIGRFDDSDLIDDHYQRVIYHALETYERMIDSGAAPEQARMVLPQSMLTSYYVSGSLAAWARAYKLRIDAHAQKEIQDLAKQWDKIISPLFPVSWKALTE